MNLSVDFQRLLPILAVGVVALAAAVLVARGVGGGSTAAGARQVLDRAFKEEPRSAALNMRISFTLQGRGGGIAVVDTVGSGVGAETAIGKPARERFHWSERVAGKDPVQLDQVSTGERGYIGVDGQWYRLSPEQYTRVFEPSKKQSLVESLGLDPRKWIRNPKLESTNAHVGGVAANQISGDVNADAVLTDLGIYKADSPRAQQFADTLRNASKHGTMDLFAGKQDGIIRKLSVTAQADASKSATPLQATLSFAIGLDRVNQPVKVEEPKGALPSSRIAEIPRAKLGNQADEILGPPARSTGKPSGTSGHGRTRQHKRAAGNKTQRSRQSYISCVQGAQDLATLERCQALLP